MTRKLLLAALALACLAVSLILPLVAFAAEIRTVGDTAIILPWGDYLVALAQMAVQIILPVIAGAILKAIFSVYPWMQMVLTQARLEQAAQALAEFGLNAVAGAAKGKTLSIDVGSAVVAAGVNRAREAVPPAVIKAAGGPEGIAKLIFRKLDLAEGATEPAVVTPALASLPRAGK